jgi:hypothetical protein
MPIDDQRRSAIAPSATSANAGSLLEYHAHRRVAELLYEAEQERLAGLARKVRPGGSRLLRGAAGRRVLQPALSLFAAFARHLVIARPGRGAG